MFLNISLGIKRNSSKESMQNLHDITSIGEGRIIEHTRSISLPFDCSYLSTIIHLFVFLAVFSNFRRKKFLNHLFKLCKEQTT